MPLLEDDEELDVEAPGNDKKKVPKDFLLLIDIDMVIIEFYNGNRAIN
jgi:hypothetical protein